MSEKNAITVKGAIQYGPLEMDMGGAYAPCFKHLKAGAEIVIRVEGGLTVKARVEEMTLDPQLVQY